MRHRNLASERIRLGMNQTECASMLGVSLKSLVRYEADEGAMPGDFIQKASELFGCSTDYLLGLTEERCPTHTA